MRRTKKGGLWIALGVLFFLAAIGLSAFNIWDSKRAGEDVEKIAEIMRNDPAVTMETETAPEDAEEELMDLAEYEIPDYQLNPDMEMPTKQIDGKSYIGMLEIPMLELSLPIAETWSYPQLRETPCRYDGSAYKGDLIISAHNYESHFGKLKTLQEGESVVFTDVDGNVFRYKVSSRETIMPKDIEGMLSGDWDLTMFTCTYGGQQRVTVRCVLVK